ncbi:MAG: MBL fold metallo-hydrolase [SAR202 cluster bacterium]|jgi:flavorubredoxin|nr:MBL fold metallo-hydrolase [SAR202 cluster bacterium]MDP6513524.1 MBL fold metallo-hydrolase [SAR202 cluster bacterium]MDP6716388.1 MBL fold metallo-hydrolase [SAR202 cluster bacterium]
MDKPVQVNSDIALLPSHLPLPIPGGGYLGINAYVLKSQQPMLVDTGMGIEPDEYMSALESVIDPSEIQWIWITHDDADHIGNLEAVMARAPKAKIITNIIGVARMETAWHIKLDMVHLVNPGETLDVGDRVLHAVRPPLFDSPATMGVYDPKSGAYFSSDCFGAFIPEPVPDARDVDNDVLLEGFGMFNKGNHPWVHLADEKKLASRLNIIKEMNPQTILSGHLAPASGMLDQFLETMSHLPSADPFVGPNQLEIEQIMAQVNAGQTPTAEA